VDSKSSGVAKIGKPPDLCWSYYSTIPGPPDKDGNPTVQSANKRAHRKCSGCQDILKSCTVVAGIAHLKACGKAKKKYPDMVSALEHNKVRKLEKKEAGSSRFKREAEEQSTLAASMVPIPKQEERHGIMKALLDMLIMCNIAFRVVDSPWFRRFCRYLRPGFIPACQLEGNCAALFVVCSALLMS